MKLGLNTYTKLLVVLCANLTFFFSPTLAFECAIVGFLGTLLLLEGKWRTTMKFWVFFIVAVALDYLLLPYLGGIFAALITVATVTTRKLLVCVMAGSLLFSTTSVSLFIYTLRSLHLPEGLVIACSVLMRFFPTLLGDYHQIRNAMKLRGIGATNTDLLRHPLQSMEYILVPLLMNATNTATDLSAASLTRGLNNPVKSTSVEKNSWRIQDFAVILVMCAFLFAFWRIRF